MDRQTIAERLASIVGRYVILTMSGDRLFWNAPAGALRSDDKRWLAAHKREIITLLAGPDADTRTRIWCDDDLDMERAPVLWIPAEGECHAPIACSRLGPCRYRVPGQPCDRRAV